MEPVTIRARELRQNQTDAELKMWELVRSRRLGVKIVRQKPILLVYFEKKQAFIADFYCSEARLVIEIDGSIHEKQEGYDQVRTLLLEQKGLDVIRFTNEEVLNDTDCVIKKLKLEIVRRLHASPPGPLSIQMREREELESAGSSPLPLCGEGPGVRRRKKEVMR